MARPGATAAAGSNAAQHREVRASESRLEFAMAGIFTLLVGGTLYYVHTLFEPLVPAGRLTIWAAITAFVTLVMAVTPVIFFVRRPDAASIERYWSPFGKLVAVLFDLAVASSVWLLLPFASEPLQLLMVIFYSAAISGQVISTAESIGTNIFAVVSIFGSAALFFLQTDTAYSASLAIFLMAFGALMLVVALILKQAIRSAIASRMHAERMSGELATALDDAQRARDARTRFIAAASHDLRQPLQAAMLFFHQMTRHPDPARRDEAVAGVRHGFAEANALLEQMMEHLRIESGAVAVHREAVPLGPLFAQLAEELRPAAQRAAIDLTALPTKLWVDADRNLTMRTLRNLLQNGIAHSGGRRLRLWARRGGASEIYIRVADDGVGLKPEFMATAFEAYVQGGQTPGKGGGMGLGLSIARELARAMDGDLTVDSRRSGGATFCLTLPASSAAAGASSPVEAPAPNIGGMAVLVIDDDPASAAALAHVLEAAGAQVRTAHDADGVAVLRDAEWRADVIVTDWHIGEGFTGADAAGPLQISWPDAGVIVMTGDGTPDTAEAVRATGWPLLWKPIEIGALMARIAATTRSRTIAEPDAQTRSGSD